MKSSTNRPTAEDSIIRVVRVDVVVLKTHALHGRSGQTCVYLLSKSFEAEVSIPVWLVCLATISRVHTVFAGVRVCNSRYCYAEV